MSNVVAFRFPSKSISSAVCEWAASFDSSFGNFELFVTHVRKPRRIFRVSADAVLPQWKQMVAYGGLSTTASFSASAVLCPIFPLMTSGSSFDSTSVLPFLVEGGYLESKRTVLSAIQHSSSIGNVCLLELQRTHPTEDVSNREKSYAGLSQGFPMTIFAGSMWWLWCFYSKMYEVSDYDVSLGCRMLSAIVSTLFAPFLPRDVKTWLELLLWL